MYNIKRKVFVKINIYFRLHSFEEVHHGTKLSNVSIIEELQVSSRMECSQRCVSTPKCRSVNLCYRKVCQLNTGDLFSKGVQMQSSFHCLFVGMKQTFVPVCNEKGYKKDIVDDKHPGMRNVYLYYSY